MESGENEEPLLRSAALQNANSVLLARRKAEEALERKTAELALALATMRTTLESTTEGILVTDDQGRVTDFNARFVQMWRLPSAVVDSRSHQEFLDYIAPQLADPGRFSAVLNGITGSDQSESFDILECADGRVFERHTKIQRVGDKIVGRVWNIRDITGHRRTEEELRQQREWFRVTLASIGDAVITTDTAGRVTFLNPIAEAMTGWTHGEARGQPLEKIFNIVNEHTRQPAANPVARVLSDGAIVGLANHTVLVGKDGTETAIEDSAAPIKDADGKITGAVMVFHDVTERRKAENALLRSEKLLSEFFENAAVGLHWVGPDGKILRANRAELNLVGYSEEEYIGHHIAEFHADAPVIEDILKRLICGENLENYEARLRCKDGSIKHVLISSNVLWENGKFIHTRCFTRDITEQKSSEDARAHLAAVVESSDDAIITKTLDSIISTWNKGAERMFGYTAAEAVGQSITMLIPAERIDEEPGILERLRRGERIDHYETVRRRKDGSLIDVALTVSPVRDRHGVIIGASKIARDVTGRKRVEETLRTSETRFRELADAMPQMVWTSPPDGNTDYYNRRWYEFTGASEGVLGDEGWLPLLHPDDMQRSLAVWRESVRTGEPLQIEHRFKNRAGEYRWHLSRAAASRDDTGKIVRWYGSSTDIHEQKLTADALREEYAVIENLNAVAGALATELDLGKIVQIITDAGSRITRAQFGAFFYNRVDEHGEAYTLYTLSGALREAFAKFPMPRATKIFGPTFRGEGVIRLDDVRKDPRFGRNPPFNGMPAGHLPVVSYLAVPVFARSGEVLGGLFFGHAQPGIFKQRDEKIVVALAAQASAAMETARLYQAEQQARGAAELANKTKDDFLAALSHELRTPLTPVLAILSSLGEDASIPPALAADLETLRRNVELETRLIDDLLDLTRVTRGKLELHCEHVPVEPMIENALNTCLPDIKARQLSLVRDFATADQTIFADGARITQVLWNVLKNAIKFTPPGGTITIHSRLVDDGGKQIRIAIEDTGVGIEPALLGHVFDAFEQGGRQITRQFGGLGLGLAISKALVEFHHGTISAASGGPGRGATFTISLPCDESAPARSVVLAAPPSLLHAAPSSVSNPHAAAPARPRRILLVEDHGDTAEIIVRLLRRSGHEVIHAGTIAAALQTAEKEIRGAGLDLVMSDLGLPDGSGLDLMRELSTKYRLRGIALSGFGMDSDRAQSTAAGFARHLTKPINIAALRATISEMMENP